MTRRRSGIEVIACARIDLCSSKQIGRACCALANLAPEGSFDFSGMPYLIPLFRGNFLREYVLAQEIDPPALETVLSIAQDPDECDDNNDGIYSELSIEGFEASGHTDLRISLTDTDYFEIYREDVLKALLDIFEQPPLSVDDSHVRYTQPYIPLGTVSPNLFYGNTRFPSIRGQKQNINGQDIAMLPDAIDDYFFGSRSEVYKTAGNPNDLLPFSVALIGVSLLIKDTSSNRDKSEEVKATRAFKPQSFKEEISVGLQTNSTPFEDFEVLTYV